MCSDPMREDTRYVTPIFKHWEKWYYEKKTTIMCISAETDINNRCFMRNGELIVEYGRHSGTLTVHTYAAYKKGHAFFLTCDYSPRKKGLISEALLRWPKCIYVRFYR